MTQVLINLLMDSQTQAQMDSFMLRNTEVDLSMVVERFLVKFMLDYESRKELNRMSREGVILEPLPTTQAEILEAIPNQSSLNQMQTASAPPQLDFTSPITSDGSTYPPITTPDSGKVEPLQLDLGKWLQGGRIDLERLAPEQVLIQESHKWTLTPTDQEEIERLKRLGLASPLLPRSRGGSTSPLMSKGPSSAPAAGSSSPKDQSKASAPSVAGDTSTEA